MSDVWFWFWGGVLGLWKAAKAASPGFLQGGFVGLEKYFFGKIVGAFVPAFFLAGAIGSWIPKSAVVKYLSPRAPRHVAYGVATFAGGLLSVCACGILPLFSAIYSRGAGIGPAVTFLFAGPAINLIAIFYTFDLLGAKLGMARVFFAFGLSILVGMVFEAIFLDPASPPEEPAAAPRPALDLTADEGREAWQTALPMLLMVVATVTLPLELERFLPFLEGTSGVLLGSAAAEVQLGVLLASAVGILVCVRAWFSREERAAWLEKTGFLMRQIVPKVILGIFLTGVLEAHVSRTTVIDYVGSSSLGANFVASLVGGILYFGTILGVVAANFFRVMGMPDGPVLALLLAGPTVTLPSVFAITEILGWRRACAYFALVVGAATVAGFLFGLV